MIGRPDHEPSGIILMAKPDGFARLCDTDDVAKIQGSWRDTLAWLRGTDPDDVEHTNVVRAVAQKAALRMPRYPEYDITTWMTKARALQASVPLAEPGPPVGPTPALEDPALTSEGPAPAPLIDVVTCILTSLGFTCTGEYNGWLNRITIELLYRQSNSFGANRELLIPALLKGPVAIRYLEGAQTELAHALKLVIRAAVAGTSSSFTNLIHMDVVTPQQRALITNSLLLLSSSGRFEYQETAASGHLFDEP